MKYFDFTEKDVIRPLLVNSKTKQCSITLPKKELFVLKTNPKKIKIIVKGFL